jgi:hypothetical protein
MRLIMSLGLVSGLAAIQPGILLLGIFGCGVLALIFALVFIALVPGDWKERSRIALEILLAFLGRKGKGGGPDSPSGQSKVSSGKQGDAGDSLE